MVWWAARPPPRSATGEHSGGRGGIRGSRGQVSSPSMTAHHERWRIWDMRRKVLRGCHAWRRRKTTRRGRRKREISVQRGSSWWRFVEGRRRRRGRGRRAEETLAHTRQNGRRTRLDDGKKEIQARREKDSNSTTWRRAMKRRSSSRNTYLPRLRPRCLRAESLSKGYHRCVLKICGASWRKEY